VEMLAVQLPGRGMRKSEPFFKTAQEAAAAVVPMVAPFVLDTPYCVVGHSLGTWLSFELLSCLRVRPNPRTAWWGTRSARGSATLAPGKPPDRKQKPRQQQEWLSKCLRGR
jgi:surfactin synthase thioesterase subunit